LQPLGLAVSVVDVYAARPVIDPDPEAIQQLASGAVLGVIVMSARSALLLNDFLDAHGLGHLRAHICVIAASPSIAVAAGDGWRQIYTAKQPRRSRLLAIATLLYHQRSSIPAAREQ
jgi:uroporphyrinogen-III synthase